MNHDGGGRKETAGTYRVLLLDIAITMLAFFLAVLIRSTLPPEEGVIGDVHSRGYADLFLLLILYKLFFNGNRHFFIRGLYAEFTEVLRYTLFLTLGLLLLLFLQNEIRGFSRMIFGVFGCLELFMTFFGHVALRTFILRRSRRDEKTTKLLLVTHKSRLQEDLARLRGKEGWSLNVTAAALFDGENGVFIRETPEGETAEEPLKEGVQELLEITRQLPLDEVLLDLPGARKDDVKEMIISFESMGLLCHYNVDILDGAASERFIQDFAGFSVISYAIKTLDPRQLFLKRLLDIFGGLAGLIITGLLTPFIALAIRLDSPGPVFFSQERIGKNGRRFRIYKFRSMFMDAEERKKALEAQNEMKGLMFKMEDDPRITRVGKFLRKTSLDELPQFYNVLTGSMSLVGTRPPTVDEFERYNLYYRRRMSVTPGLTGMWQVYGRGVVDDFEDVVRYDLDYIDHWSLGLDIKLLIKTFGVVLSGKGSV